MSESNGVSLKWAQFIIGLALQTVLFVGGLGAVYGTIKFQVEDLARRVDNIEKREDANFIPRSEYDKRHLDLQEQLKEIRDEIRDLQQRKVR